MLFFSGIEAEKAAESLRKGTFLEESLPVVILGAVGILGSELMSPPYFLLKKIKLRP